MKTLPNPLYYLENFKTVLNWISVRYDDLLNAPELVLISRFSVLPQPSQCLLVRMIMRKGRMFRSGKLKYEEIGCPHVAAQPLIDTGWVSDTALLGADDLFPLLTKDELASVAKMKAPAGIRKTEILEAMRLVFREPRPYSHWRPDCKERIYTLSPEVEAACDTFRLMFFGNLHQDWTEFVLAELGVFQYEKVCLDAASRAFRCRQDVEYYRRLYRCREYFEAGAPLDELLSELADKPDNEWLRSRHAKLIFQLAQEFERSGELEKALGLYRDCSYPQARLRAIRVLEKLSNWQEAFEIAQHAASRPNSEAESQQLARVLPRLRRKLSMDRLKAAQTPAPVQWSVTLPRPQDAVSVEHVVQAHLNTHDEPVYYVENLLINGLFGLLCWDAVFHPVPGAFFHPFQSGPADLHSADFFCRRQAQFDACFAELADETYKATIRRRFREKWGLASPFVFWMALSEELLELALLCVPPMHLRRWFERLLLDIKSNRNGFPDLIQFFVKQRGYRMIEVKGPGDRLQDNQQRMFGFAHAHGIPVEVCHVAWREPEA